MLTEITDYKIGRNNDKIKIGNYYVGFSERQGFTLQVCLGLATKSINTTYCYYTLGVIKGIAQRASRHYRYYIDMNYMKKTLEFNLEDMLNNKLEPSLLDITDLQLFNLGDELDTDIINNWYLKNRIMNKKLPEICNCTPRKVKKKDLEIGRIYTNFQGTDYFVYIGNTSNGYCFYEISTYVVNRIGIDNLVTKSLLKNVAKLRGKSYISKEEFIDKFTTTKKTMPKLYILDENFVTNNGVTKFLGKNNKINID